MDENRRPSSGRRILMGEVRGALRPRREPARQALPLRQAIIAGIAPLFLALIVGVGFIAAYAGALHNPKPDHVPVAVVRGDQPAQALLTAVTNQGRQLVAITYDSVAAADHALERRAVYAVLASSTTGPGLTLTVASAGGPGAVAFVAAFLSVAAQRVGVPLSVTDAIPVDPDDPRGVVPFYLALGLVVGGYFGGIALSLALGTVPRGLSRAGVRMAGLALHSVLLSLAGTLIVGPGLGIWSQNMWGLFGAGVLLSYAAALFASAVQSILARVGTTLIILLIVVLGNPGSGGIYPPEFLPGFFRGIHEWDLPGLGSDLIRAVVYFPPGTAAWPAGKLAIWCVASAAVLLAATYVLGRSGRRAPD